MCPTIGDMSGEFAVYSGNLELEENLSKWDIDTEPVHIYFNSPQEVTNLSFFAWPVDDDGPVYVSAVYSLNGFVVVSIS